MTASLIPHAGAMPYLGGGGELGKTYQEPTNPGMGSLGGTIERHALLLLGSWVPDRFALLPRPSGDVGAPPMDEAAAKQRRDERASGVGLHPDGRGTSCAPRDPPITTVVYTPLATASAATTGGPRSAAPG